MAIIQNCYLPDIKNRGLRLHENHSESLVVRCYVTVLWFSEDHNEAHVYHSVILP